MKQGHRQQLLTDTSDHNTTDQLLRQATEQQDRYDSGYADSNDDGQFDDGDSNSLMMEIAMMAMPASRACTSRWQTKAKARCGRGCCWLW